MLDRTQIRISRPATWLLVASCCLSPLWFPSTALAQDAEPEKSKSELNAAADQKPAEKKEKAKPAKEKSAKKENQKAKTEKSPKPAEPKPTEAKTDVTPEAVSPVKQSPDPSRLDAIESKMDAILQMLQSPPATTAPSEAEAKTETKQADAEKASDETSAAKEPAAEKKPAPAKPIEKTGVAIQSDWLNDLPWRSIGPANMSGRITDLAIHNDDPSLWWIGTGGGGLLKTSNHGVNLEHQFDYETTVSVGAVAHDPSNKEIVWVGTGEANPRNSVSYGDGVYKSVDGGKKWTHLGLKETYQISRILVDPKDSDTVYVGACGRLYGSNRERGVFKTTDGGKTWEQSLYVDDRTGVIDMVMNPEDPNMLIAAMWDRERDEFDSWPGSVPRPEGVDSYDPIRKWGPGAGLYRTTDAGETWTKITAGLPSGMMGRIGLDWQLNSPNTLYAIIDCEDIGKGPQPSSAYLGLVGTDRPTENEADPESVDAVVTQVMPESPADKAGIQVGDRLLTIDGNIANQFDDLLDALRKKNLGDKIRLTLKRGDDTIEVATKLPGRPGSRQSVPTVWLGVTGEEAEGQVVLKTVSKDSPAEKAKLEPGDIILKAGEKKPESYDALIKQVQELSDGEELKLDVKRGDDTLSIVATITNRPQRGNPPASRAIMGIQGEDEPSGGAKMLSITDGGPSEKAGMKSGDVVVKVDDSKIESYESLIAEIRKRQPDDKMKVVVKRGEKPVNLEITLGDRNANTSTRPYTYSYYGQTPNVQDMQGAKGHEYGGVYKSTDSGETWTRVNSLNTRPMYFSVIRVDPSDDQRVYVLGVSQFKSTNGGLTFESNFGRGVHADAHDLWINPKDGRHMVIAGDGGVYASFDYGQNWDHINTAAIGQFYHVAISPKEPYWVVGGLQDNGSWAGPAISRKGGTINEDWVSVAGGDGFVCRVDSNDPDLMYYESQNGNIGRRHLVTGERASIRPQRQRGVEYRFNWETPFILSNHNSRIFYSAGNYVFRSLDRGNDLQVISPEITRTQRGSATDLAESPRDPNVLYVGSDDGALWVTTDGGTNWSDITANLNAPGPRWVSTVEASRFRTGTVYVCLDGHRSDDDNPYAYVSDDFGQTFRPLHRDLPRGSTRCLREDPKNPNLLYLGTEFAFWVTLDRGESWAQCNQKVPSVSIHDVAVHPTQDEIVLATHGRSLWACDMSVLRSINKKSLAEKHVFFPPQDVIRWRREPSRGGTNRRYVGENPSRGAQLWYSLSDDAKSALMRIKSIEGDVISEVKADAKKGLHKVSWNMTQTRSANSNGSERSPSGFRGRARAVPSGSYQVALVVDGKEVQTRVVTLLRDPSLPSDAVADEVYEQQLLRDEMAAKLKSQAKDDGVDVYKDN